VNFLAHSLFGFDDSALIAGQFCGDFVRGSDLSHLPAGIESGIRLHRFLDRFTDTHPALLPARQNMQSVPHRLAGIVVDVMFDHYLARHWSTISPLTLDEHALQVHTALADHQAHFPPGLLRFMAFIERDDILQNNINLPAIEQTLQRIASRSEKFQAIALPVDELHSLRDKLVMPFDAFLPDVQQAALAFLQQRRKLDIQQ